MLSTIWKLSCTFALLSLFAACGTSDAKDTPAASSGPSPHLRGIDPDTVDWKAKTEAWWQQTLEAQTFTVCRRAGTERPWTGDLLHVEEAGVFTCSSCGQSLFDKKDKFESGSGWPPFTRAIDPAKVSLHRDMSLGMVRTEVRCSRCDAHLGHVFDDGPAPTGQRFCINSVCLDHRPSRDTPASPPPQTATP